jgi:hypothetical protein
MSGPERFTDQEFLLAEVAYDAWTALFNPRPFTKQSLEVQERWVRANRAVNAIKGSPAGLTSKTVALLREDVRKRYADARKAASEHHPFWCWDPTYTEEHEAVKVEASNAGFAACRYVDTLIDKEGFSLGDSFTCHVRNEAGAVEFIEVAVILRAT